MISFCAQSRQLAERRRPPKARVRSTLLWARESERKLGNEPNASHDDSEPSRLCSQLSDCSAAKSTCPTGAPRAHSSDIELPQAAECRRERRERRRRKPLYERLSTSSGEAACLDATSVSPLQSRCSSRRAGRRARRAARDCRRIEVRELAEEGEILGDDGGDAAPLEHGLLRLVRILAAARLSSARAPSSTTLGRQSGRQSARIWLGTIKGRLRRGTGRAGSASSIVRTVAACSRCTGEKRAPLSKVKKR